MDSMEEIGMMLDQTERSLLAAFELVANTSSFIGLMSYSPDHVIRMVLDTLGYPWRAETDDISHSVGRLQFIAPEFSRRRSR